MRIKGVLCLILSVITLQGTDVKVTLGDLEVVKKTEVAAKEAVAEVKEVTGVGKSTKRFFTTKQLELKFISLSGDERYKKWQVQMASLISMLKKETSDVILFTLGAGGNEDLEQPKYFLSMAKLFSKKSYSIYSIDAMAEPVSSQDGNISFNRFATVLPYNNQHKFVGVLESLISRKIKAGGVVFIGNHTQMYNFSEVVPFVNAYLRLKSVLKSSNLIFYSAEADDPILLLHPNVDKKKFTIHKSAVFFEKSDDELEPAQFYTTKEVKFTSFTPESGLTFKVQNDKGMLKIISVTGEYARPDEVLDYIQKKSAKSSGIFKKIKKLF